VRCAPPTAIPQPFPLRYIEIGNEASGEVSGTNYRQLYHVNDIAWPVNLIGFDHARVVRRSSYHVQQADLRTGEPLPLGNLTNRETLRVETRTLTASDRVKVKLAPGGGATLLLVP
jgi:hypothetical protein